MDDEIRKLERAALEGDSQALATLRDSVWPRYHDEPVLCPKCQRSVARRGLKDHEARCTGQAGNSVAKVAEKIIPFPLAARVLRMPYWDRFAIPATPAGSSIFVAIFNYTGHDPVDGRPKGPADCNLGGGGGAMPYGHHFRWHGVSLVPDAGSDRRSVETVWNEAVLEFTLGPSSRPLLSWPCRDVMQHPSRLPLDGDPNWPPTDDAKEPLSAMAEASRRYVRVTVPGTVRRNTPRGVVEERREVPVEIASQEGFRFSLVSERLTGSVDRMFRAMLLLHGIQLRPLA